MTITRSDGIGNVFGQWAVPTVDENHTEFAMIPSSARTKKRGGGGKRIKQIAFTSHFIILAFGSEPAKTASTPGIWGNEMSKSQLLPIQH